MGNKQRMSIRALGPHVGTDPVSVRLSANSVYRPHNVFRPCRPGCGQTRGLSLHAGLPPELASVVYYPLLAHRRLKLILKPDLRI